MPRRHVRAGIGVAILVGITFGGLSAAGAAAPRGGVIKVWLHPSPETTSAKHPGTVLFTGAIADHGTSIRTSLLGKATKKGTYATLHLTKGTILVNTANLEQALLKTKPVVNSSNCSFSVSATPTVLIQRGTKGYAGITGNVAFSVRTGGLLPRNKKGACTEKRRIEPSAAAISFVGSGTVSFSAKTSS